MEGYFLLFLDQRRSEAVGMEGSHVTWALGRHGGRRRRQSCELATAQRRPAGGRVTDQVGRVEGRSGRGRASKREEQIRDDSEVEKAVVYWFIFENDIYILYLMLYNKLVVP